MAKIALLVSLFLVVTGTCRESFAKTSPKPAKELKILTIAHAANFSTENFSQMNPLNSAYSDAARMAVADFEKRFAKLGYEVRILNLDYGAKEPEAARVAEEAVKSEALAAVGFYQSGRALIAAPILVKGQMPFVLPTASAVKLNDFGPLVKMLTINNRQMAEQMVKIAKDRVKAKKALLITDTECAFCVDLSTELKPALDQAKIPFTALTFAASQTDFSEITKTALADSYDILILPNEETPTVRLAKSLYASGLNLPLLGGDGWGNNLTSGFFETFNKPDFQAYAIGHWNPAKASERGKRFSKLWLNRFYREPTNVWAMVYEGTSFLLQTMHEMLLAKTPLNRASLAKKMAETKSYQGMVSRFVFESPTSPPKRNIVVLKANPQKKRFDPIELVWVD